MEFLSAVPYAKEGEMFRVIFITQGSLRRIQVEQNVGHVMVAELFGINNLIKKINERFKVLFNNGFIRIDIVVCW